MATTTAMTDQYRQHLMQKKYDHTATTGDVFKIALIKVAPAGTYGKGSVNFSDITGNSDEVTGTGYTTGGFAWTAAQNTTPSVTNHVATATWTTNPSWTTATFSATAGMIYDSTVSNEAVSTHDFGGTQTVTAGTLTLVLPTNNDTSAILRLA